MFYHHSALMMDGRFYFCWFPATSDLELLGNLPTSSRNCSVVVINMRQAQIVKNKMQSSGCSYDLCLSATLRHGIVVVYKKQEIFFACDILHLESYVGKQQGNMREPSDMMGRKIGELYVHEVSIPVLNVEEEVIALPTITNKSLEESRTRRPSKLIIDKETKLSTKTLKSNLKEINYEQRCKTAPEDVIMSHSRKSPCTAHLFPNPAFLFHKVRYPSRLSATTQGNTITDPEEKEIVTEDKIDNSLRASSVSKVSSLPADMSDDEKYVKEAYSLLKWPFSPIRDSKEATTEDETDERLKTGFFTQHMMKQSSRPSTSAAPVSETSSLPIDMSDFEKYVNEPYSLPKWPFSPIRDSKEAITEDETEERMKTSFFTQHMMKQSSRPSTSAAPVSETSSLPIDMSDFEKYVNEPYSLPKWPFSPIRDSKEAITEDETEERMKTSFFTQHMMKQSSRPSTSAAPVSETSSLPIDISGLEKYGNEPYSISKWTPSSKRDSKEATTEDETDERLKTNFFTQLMMKQSSKPSTSSASVSEMSSSPANIFGFERFINEERVASEWRHSLKRDSEEAFSETSKKVSKLDDMHSDVYAEPNAPLMATHDPDRYSDWTREGSLDRTLVSLGDKSLGSSQENMGEYLDQFWNPAILFQKILDAVRDGVCPLNLDMIINRNYNESTNVSRSMITARAFRSLLILKMRGLVEIIKKPNSSEILLIKLSPRAKLHI